MDGRSIPLNKTLPRDLCSEESLGGLGRWRGRSCRLAQPSSIRIVRIFCTRYALLSRLGRHGLENNGSLWNQPGDLWLGARNVGTAANEHNHRNTASFFKAFYSILKDLEWGNRLVETWLYYDDRVTRLIFWFSRIRPHFKYVFHVLTSFFFSLQREYSSTYFQFNYKS